MTLANQEHFMLSARRILIEGDEHFLEQDIEQLVSNFWNRESLADIKFLLTEALSSLKASRKDTSAYALHEALLQGDPFAIEKEMKKPSSALLFGISELMLLAKFYMVSYERMENESDKYLTLIEAGNDVQLQAPDGSTFLQMLKGKIFDPNILEQLIEKGADPTAVDEFGQSFFFSYRLEITKSLIETIKKKGWSFRGTMGQDLASKIIAKPLNETSIDVLKILMQENADSETFFNPMLIKVIENKNVRAIDLLLENSSIDFNQKSHEVTPLIVAIKSQDFSTIEKLLKKKMNPNQVIETHDLTTFKPNYISLLDYLILKINPPNFKITELLLKYGADLNQVDTNQNSLLHSAVINKNLPVIEYLLSKRINKDLKNKEGMAALELAGRMQQGNLYELIAKSS